MPRSFYEILQVSPAATMVQIRRAYRAAARTLHPDTNPAPDAARRFAEVAAAYETLRDRDRRRQYDEMLRRAASANGAPPQPGTAHFTWSNIASPAPHRPQVEPIDEPVPTDLDRMYQAFFGRRSGGPPPRRS
jgi:curved DNA-binding protein CbpA